MIIAYDTAILAARYLTATTAVVNSLETLSSRSVFATDGILGWPLLVTGHRRAWAPVESVRDSLFSQQGTTILVCLRLLIAAALFIPFLGRTSAGVLILALLGVQCLLAYRSGFGGDGSGQMSTIVLFGLAYNCFATGHGILRDAGLWFIAIECVMSYFVAGVAKVISPKWRSGAAPREILRSSTYGSPTGVALLKAMPAGSGIIAWSTIIVECLFPLVLFAPLPVVVVLLVAGFLFHLGNAAFMGLNTFLTAFLAAYPIILLLNPHIR